MVLTGDISEVGPRFLMLRRAIKLFLLWHVLCVFVLPEWWGMPVPISVPIHANIFGAAVCAGLLFSIITHTPRVGAVSALAYAMLVVYVGWSQSLVVTTLLYTGFAMIAVGLAAILWRPNAEVR